MFAITRVKISIVRNAGRSGLFVLTSVILLCFLSLYCNSIVSNEQLLTTMGTQIPVTATIANANGSREFGLAISTKTADGFAGLGVSDPVFTAESYGNIDKGTLGADSGIISIYLIGANSMAAFSFGADAVTADAPLSFLAGDEAQCLMNSDYQSRNGLAVETGDVISVNLYRAEYDDYGTAFSFVAVAPVQLEVVGFYTHPLSGGIESAAPDIICPVRWLRQQYEAAHTLFQYSSAKGTVSDPLSLNAFKERAAQLRLRQVDPQAGFSRTGNALLISDKVFMQTASQVLRNIRTLRLFLAPSVVLVFLLVTLLSFFLSRSRRDDILIAKCLGMKKRSLMLDLVLENCVLALTGGIAAAVVLLLTSQLVLSVYWLLLPVFLACVFAGSLTSAFLLTRANMMRLLSQAD